MICSQITEIQLNKEVDDFIPANYSLATTTHFGVLLI